MFVILFIYIYFCEKVFNMELDNLNLKSSNQKDDFDLLLQEDEKKEEKNSSTLRTKTKKDELDKNQGKSSVDLQPKEKKKPSGVVRKRASSVESEEFIVAKVKMSASIYRRLRLLSVVEGTTVGSELDEAGILLLNKKADLIKGNF